MQLQLHTAVVAVIVAHALAGGMPHAVRLGQATLGCHHSVIGCNRSWCGCWTSLLLSRVLLANLSDANSNSSSCLPGMVYYTLSLSVWHKCGRRTSAVHHLLVEEYPGELLPRAPAAVHWARQASTLQPREFKKYVRWKQHAVSRVR